MPSPPLPDWLLRVPGEAPILLVAPHGGRRPPASELDPGAMRKVNDLHTAEVTVELAARLRAAAIVNRGVDRNIVDLNKVSHVRTRAPWLLDLLLESVRAQLAAADRATLLFVHGWNAIQPSCDLGIGARLDREGFVAVKQGAPTIPLDLLPRLSRFAEACRDRGIDVTVGDRYPAAGRENVMQIFSRRYVDDADPRIRELAGLAAAGRIFAVQLELATPLRWPGPLRDGVIEAIAELTVDRGVSQAVDLRETVAMPCEPLPTDHLGIEFHDGPAGVGAFAATERLPSGKRQGRFLLCVGAHRLALFTGEDAWPRDDSLRCMDLAWRRSDDGEVHLDFLGPCLTFPRTDPFLDLEEGLSEATLSELEARLVWKPLPGSAVDPRSRLRLGRVEGRVRHDGWSSAISAPGVLQDGAPSRDSLPWQERRALRIPLGGDDYAAVVSRVDQDERLEGQIIRGGRAESIISGRISVHNPADALVPEAWRIEDVSRTGTLRVFGHVTHAIPVVRPAPEGKVLTLFGLARFSTDDRVGYGTFEQSQRLTESKGGIP